jgi:hypothetical protein
MIHIILYVYAEYVDSHSLLHTVTGGSYSLSRTGSGKVSWQSLSRSINIYCAGGDDFGIVSQYVKRLLKCLHSTAVSTQQNTVMNRGEG